MTPNTCWAVILPLDPRDARNAPLPRSLNDAECALILTNLYF